MEETVRVAITDSENGFLVSVVETTVDPTKLWVVVLNADWSNI